jgi:hypothetical protein
MKARVTLACVASAVVSAAAVAAVPNFFVAGTPASAAQVNQNFAYVDQRAGSAIGTLLTLGRAASSDVSTGVASVSCPDNALVLSASCKCDYAGGTRNFGVLFACTVAGNGAVVGCFDEAGSFNPNLPPPRGDVAALCLSGANVDGVPLFVFHPAKARQDGEDLAAKVAEVRKAEDDRAAAARRAGR